MTRLLATVLALELLAESAAAQDRWAVADSGIVRLAPAQFVQLPAAIRSALEQRQCMIPQSRFTMQPHNVIRGHFRSDAATDWAVLCSVRHVSAILVFWGGAADSVVALGATADRVFLQIMPGDTIAFSRELHVANARDVREREADTSLLAGQAVSHDGIDDGFQGKGSVVWFYVRGRWLRLAGPD